MYLICVVHDDAHSFNTHEIIDKLMRFPSICIWKYTNPKTKQKN